VPELRNIPGNLVHEPWKLTPMEQNMYAFAPGIDYPLPLVDLEVAARNASERMYAFKKTPQVLSASQPVLKKHVRHPEKRKLQ
jgi:deoxyribodipyrimidine photo-lyase